MSFLGERSYDNVDMFCGSTIIATRYAVTAAHCLLRRSASTTVLVVGDHDLNKCMCNFLLWLTLLTHILFIHIRLFMRTAGESEYYAQYLISQFIINTAYSTEKRTNDIALVKTAKDIVFNMGVGPACLPFRWVSTLPYTYTYAWVCVQFTFKAIVIYNRFTSATFDNRPLDVVGWGTLEYGGQLSKKLMKATVHGYPYASCSQAYEGQVIDTQLCTFARWLLI